METFFLLIVAGIVINLFSRFASTKLGHIRGIDTMPAFPIIAGYLYGVSAGVWTGVILAVAYHLTNPRSIPYMPLTLATNVMIGILASLLASWGLFGEGLALLVLYHGISMAVVSMFRGPGPGYLTFVFVNAATSILILFVAASTL